MILFAAGFPAAELLLENSGVIAIIALRNAVGFAVLLALLRLLQRQTKIFSLPWRTGFQFGFVGFGWGAAMCQFQMVWVLAFSLGSGRVGGL